MAGVELVPMGGTEKAERLTAALGAPLNARAARRAFYYLDLGVGTLAPDGLALLAARLKINNVLKPETP